jgi:hypothetical protein
MADRKAGLDSQHCRAAMRELALLHALSLAMKLRRPQEFVTRVAACVREALFVPENEEWYRGYYRAATRNALTMVSIHLRPQYCLNSVFPCGGGLKYLHGSPASRKRLRKGNPVPGGITGPPCSE